MKALEREFLAKWKAKHQQAFRYPPAHKPKMGEFCFVCGIFMSVPTEEEKADPEFEPGRCTECQLRTYVRAGSYIGPFATCRSPWAIAKGNASISM
jgi:hypothetical protein